MFCGCAADYFGKEPNTLCCPVCLGLPGALPVPNKKAIEWTILLGLALDCKVNLHSKFDRKNYFYPDLPKGYQISQYDQPFAIGGSLKLKIKNEKLKVDEDVTIRINRVHLEEDTGKLTHAVTNEGEMTLIDFNRSGVPLVEIVTEPDFHDLTKVKEYLKELQRIVRYLGISDADMEKGTMRIEPSISLSTYPNKLADYRVEIKNINSFKFAERAILYEIKRQTEMLNKGIKPEQETRGYDENKGITILQRSKENAEDYRYFPEPDIPPFEFTQEFVDSIKKRLKELPQEKQERFVNTWKIKESDARVLTEDINTANAYEGTVSEISSRFPDKPPEEIAMGTASAFVNRRFDMHTKANIIKPVSQIADEVINIINPIQTTISEEEIEKVIRDVFAKNEKAVTDYKSGKKQVLGFLTGLCMRELKGKVDVKTVQEIITKLI
jgi:aspartyl-tRNA(Asn)/glutamyl-tRNA(Gln) amidotransferase subunit B